MKLELTKSEHTGYHFGELTEGDLTLKIMVGPKGDCHLSAEHRACSGDRAWQAVRLRHLKRLIAAVEQDITDDKGDTDAKPTLSERKAARR